MWEYSLATGPLSSFERWFDPTNMRRIAEYPTLSLTPRIQGSDHSSECYGNPDVEADFLHSLLLAFPPAYRPFAGYADRAGGRAESLSRSLNRTPLRSALLTYGAQEGHVLLYEMLDVRTDFGPLREHYPPGHGMTFFNASCMTFEMFEILWARKCADRCRSSDTIRYDALELMMYSKAMILVDDEGSFLMVALPTYLSVLALERLIDQAAHRARLPIAMSTLPFG